MSSIGLIFNFELKAILRKKSFIITTIILVLIIVASIVLPSLLIKDGEETIAKDSLSQAYPANLEEITSDEEVLDLMGQGGYFAPSDFLNRFILLEVFDQQFSSESDLKEALNDERISFAVIFHSEENFEFITNGQNHDMAYQIVYQSLLQHKQLSVMDKLGLSAEQIPEIYNLDISGEIIDMSQRETGNIIFGMAYMFLMYMVIILYGSTVSTSVAREKDNRTMEVLIANTKPDYLIVGKTFAAGAAGLVQISILALSFFAALKFSGLKIMEFFRIIEIDIDRITIIATIYFAITGYLLYLFIYAALGAMVSKLEDVNYAVTPITLMLVAAYIITFTSIEMPNNLLFKIASFIPFTSVLVMPVRCLVVYVPGYELFISAAIMLITIILLSYLAIRIYRLGSLNYGNRMKFAPTMKMIFRGEDK